MARALIGLGSNLGDRQRSLDGAVARLKSLDGCRLLARSRWHETVPVGGPAGQSPFLNGAAKIATTLPPLALLEQLQAIERDLKRERHETWGARTLDLDLLLYDQLVLETPALTLPHPRMAFRRFVLAPANEVAANWLHPVIGWTIGELLEHLDTALPYVAIGGSYDDDRQRLAAGVAASLTSRLISGPPAFFQPLPPGDTAGRDLQPAIELLDRQADLLESIALVGLIVSDFWFGQMLMEARVAFGQEAFGRFESHWRQRNGRLVQPKLIIWLHDAGDVAADANRVPSQRLAGQLGQRVDLSGWGPVLEVGPHRAVTPLADAIAAIQAMA